MERAAVEALVEKHLGPLKRWYDLHHWDVTVDFGRFDHPDTAMECTRNTPYNLATIKIDPEKIADADAFLEHFTHEMIHLLLAPFDLYHRHSTQNYPKDSLAENQEHIIWTYSVEQAVVHQLRIFRERMKTAYLAQFKAAASTEDAQRAG